MIEFLAGPVGFDPTTTGSGGLCFFISRRNRSAPCPSWATDPLQTQLHELSVIYNGRLLYMSTSDSLPSSRMAIMIKQCLYKSFMLLLYTLSTKFEE
jgi:hypothetical protein